MSDKPQDRILSADGSAGWYAFAPDGSSIDGNDEPWEPPPVGSVIRSMGEHTVTIPLWSDQDGLMFSEPRELIEAFGVSHALAKALKTWGIAWEAQAGNQTMTRTPPWFLAPGRMLLGAGDDVSAGALRDAGLTGAACSKYRQPLVGTCYLPTVTDDHSRVAYVEAREDETKETAAAVLRNGGLVR